MNPATRAALAGIRRRPRQALLTGLAVLVATVFAAGSALLTGTMRDTLVADAVHTPPGASWVLEAPFPTSGPALAARVAAVPGVTDVVVGYRGAAPVTYRGTTGRWQVSSDPGGGPLSALGAPRTGTAPGPGQVLVGPGTAERDGIRPGDRIEVAGRAFTVAGAASRDDDRTDGGDSLVLAPADAAALGDRVRAYRIDVAGTPDGAALQAAAGGVTVRSGADERTAEIDSASAVVTAVRVGLSVFVGLALVAATVVVASTFRIVLARRGRQLALLRCVGASRAQVTRSVLVEAGLIGLVTGVAGAGVAVGLGWAAIGVARVAGVDAPALVVSPGALVGCVLLAVVATVVAAVSPALAAGRVPPVVALGSADASEARAPRPGRRLPVAAVLAGVAVGLGGLGMAVPDALGLPLLGLSGLVLFAALVVVGPFLVSATATVLRPLAARSGPARLAVANARRVSRRTAATTTVLALGVGLTAALLVGIDGAATEARDSIARSYPAAVSIVSTSDTGRTVRADREAAARALAARLAEHRELLVRTDDAEVLVDPAPGADPNAVRTAVARATDGRSVDVVWAADRRAEADRMVTVLRATGAGLVGVTLLVAIIGVGVTLALSVTERTREIALLRAFGLSRAGARRSVAVEAALAGTVGAVPGVVLGGLYGALGLRSVGLAGSAPPIGQLVALGVGIVLVAVLSAWAPMRRAGRVEPAQGLVAP